jgi:hypothetical protein
MRNTTAQKILKMPKKERDHYLDVIEALYGKYKEDYGSREFGFDLDSAGAFKYHDVDFLKASSTDVISFLFSEGILKKETIRIGPEYETAVEVQTLVLKLDEFNPLISALNIDEVPKHIRDMSIITLDLSSRTLFYKRKPNQFKDKHSFELVIVKGIFENYPDHFLLDDETIRKYGLEENRQSLNAANFRLNNKLKELTGIKDSFITYSNYIFTLRPGIKVQITGADPRDYN